MNGGGGRQENAFMNDMVALLRPHNLAAKVGITRFQNAGDFRTHEESLPVSITPHDTNLNIALNFLKSIRKDLGLTTDLSPDILEKCIEKADAAIPKTKRTFFIGDYADRGDEGVEVIERIFHLLRMYPDRVIALKGNHEVYTDQGQPRFSSTAIPIANRRTIN